jgi:hypothetical protein
MFCVKDKECLKVLATFKEFWTFTVQTMNFALEKPVICSTLSFAQNSAFNRMTFRNTCWHDCGNWADYK